MSDQHAAEHVLDERYQIKGVLGKGGMGIVYHVFDKILGIDVAIKMLQADSMGQASIRLQREAIAAGKMQNANIARIFDFGQSSDGSPYMVMELVSGKSLSQFIQENGALPYKTAMRIFIQICHGLAHAHSNGIVHRDLKPSNIMLIEQADGNHLAKILDFGVAKMETDQHLTSAGSILGSPLYMSPEQADGLTVDYRSDIYSLGCLMFESLTGQPPLKGNSALETMSMHKNVAPPLVSEIFSDPVPPELVALVDDCLRKRPDDRPESAKAIEKKLDNILNPVVVDTSAPAPKPVYRPETEAEKRLSKFSKSQALIIGGVLAIGAATALYFTNNYFQSRDKETEPALKATSKTITPLEKEYDEAANKNPNIEYTTFDGTPAVITKKSTTDADLADLNTSKFFVLKLKKGHTTGSGLAYLTKKPITWIDVRATEFDCKNLKYISQFQKLEKLELTKPELTDSNLKEVAKSKSIKDLTIRGGRITNNGIASLAEMPKLEKLGLYNCPSLTKEAGKKIALIKSLKYFRPPADQSESSWKSIAASKIDNLDLIGLSIGAKSFEIICSNPKLEFLCISDIKLAGNNYSALEKLKNLKTLGLHHATELPPALIDAASRLNVSVVDLSYSNVNRGKLFALLNNPNLTKLICNNCPKITKEDTARFEADYEKKWNKKVIAENVGFDPGEIDELKKNPLMFEP